MKYYALFLAALLLGTPFGRADTKTWIPTGTDAWDFGASWSGGTEPGINDDAVISNGGTAYFFGLNNSIRNLYLNNGGIRWDAPSIFSTSSTSFIGLNGGSGTVTVGSGGTWNSAMDIIIGSSGTGLMEIKDGSLVTNTFSFIGSDSGVTGTVNVTGTNSRWTQSQGVVVGHNGIGNLNITAGGMASNLEATVGRYTSATGIVMVNGSGSVWSNSGNIVLGRQGKGTLTLQNGGVARAGWNGSTATGTVALGELDLSIGRINIGGATLDSATATGAGTLQAATITSGSSLREKEINFNHTNTSYTFAPNITGNIKVFHYGSANSVTSLTGTNTYTGGTEIRAGTLQIGDGGTTGSITGTVENYSTLAFKRFDAAAFNITILRSGGIAQNGTGTITLLNSLSPATVSAISGSQIIFKSGLTAAFTKTGLGTAVLEGASTGGVTINAGIVRLGNGSTSGSLTGDATIASGATLVFNRSDTASYGGKISGAGGISKLGTNALTLTGILEYTGTTSISGGSLTVQRGTITGNTSGAGSLIKSNDFSMDVLGALGHTGGTQIQDGTLVMRNNSTLSSSVSIASGATLEFNRSSDYSSFAGIITGAGTITTAAYSTTLPVLGLSGFTGDFNLAGATSALHLNLSSGSSTMANSISGIGTLIKSGAGTLIYTGSNTNNREFFVNEGKLQIGNGGTTGEFGTAVGTRANIAGGATLEFNRSDSTVFGGKLAGTGTLVKSGSNTLTLTGSISDFDGNTVISGGTLAFSRAFSTEVYPGGISGSGTLLKQGSYSLQLEGPLTHTGGTTIENGTLILSPAIDTTYAGNFDGAGNLTIGSGGRVIYTGTSTISGATVVASGGILQLGNGGGTGSISGDIGLMLDSRFVVNRNAVTLGNKFSGTGSVENEGNGKLTLTGDFSNFAGIFGGSGAIDLASSENFQGVRKQGTGTLRIIGNVGGSIIHEGGTIQIGDGATSGTFGPGIIQASNTTDAVIRFDRTDTTSASMDIRGPASLVKAGSNTLTIHGNLTYTGATTIEGGRLVLNNPSEITLSSVISGAGALEFSGAGLVILDKPANHTGGTYLTGLGLSTSSTITGTVTSSAGSTLTLNPLNGPSSRTMDYVGNGNLTIPGSHITTINGILTHTGTTTMGDSSAVLELGDSRDFVFRSAFQNGGLGGGILRKQGSGTMTITSPALGAVSTFVDAGTVRTALLGTSTTAGREAAQIASGAALILDRSDDATFSGTIINLGTFTKSGSNKITLTGLLKQNGLVSTGTTNISGGTLALSMTDNRDLSGLVQGSGILEKMGSGTLTLTGTATHSGGTVISDGALAIGSTGSLSGNVTVQSGATLQFLRALSFDGDISGGGGISQASNNEAILTGALSYSGNTSIALGTLTFNSASNVTLAGNVSGTARLRKVGTSTLKLSGDGSGFTGTTEHKAGTLELASSNTIRGTLRLQGGRLTTDSSARTLSATTLAVDNNSSIGGNGGDLTVSGNLIGSAMLTKFGTNTLILTNGNGFGGATVINGGTVRLSGGTLGSPSNFGDLTVNPGGTFDLGASVNLSNNLTLDGGTITGTTGKVQIPFGGSVNLRSGTFNAVLETSLPVNKSTPGKLVLNGANVYTGATNVTDGELQVTGSIASSSMTTVSGSGSLSGNGTVGKLTIGSGGTLSPGNSPGTLTSGNTIFEEGGTYLWEVNDATGTQGADSGWDWQNIAGTLAINSTVAEPFTITVRSLSLSNVLGSAANFDPGLNYSWTIAMASGGIIGFSEGKFAIDASEFLNAPDSSRFSLEAAGNNLVLTYTVPEPGSASLLAGTFLLCMARRRRN